MNERHGQWIDPVPEGCMMWDKNAYRQCSVCGEKQFLAHKMKYCPHCGAKMESDWNRVEDKLPPMNTDVLICAVNKTTGKQDILITYMKDEMYLYNSPIPIEPQWQSPYQYFFENNTITHWMPLPQPPDKEQDQDEEA